jgi:hypothetical protein
LLVVNMVDDVGRLRLDRPVQLIFVPEELLVTNPPPKFGSQRRVIDNVDATTSMSLEPSQAPEASHVAL